MTVRNELTEQFTKGTGTCPAVGVCIPARRRHTYFDWVVSTNAAVLHGVSEPACGASHVF